MVGAQRKVQCSESLGTVGPQGPAEAWGRLCVFFCLSGGSSSSSQDLTSWPGRAACPLVVARMDRPFPGPERSSGIVVILEPFPA